MSYNVSSNYTLGKYVNRPDIPPLGWSPDSKEAVNQHGLVCGKSGSGKTTLLLEIIKYLYFQNKHIFVFDLKGDLIIRDDDGNKIGNYIEFTAWDSEYGINIFEFDTGLTLEELKYVIDNNLELTDAQSFAIRNAGPKVQIKRIVDLFKKNFFYTMGTLQKNMLTNLLADTYKYKDFKLKDISTWLNKLPSLQDTVDLIEIIKEINGVRKRKNDELSDSFIQTIKPELYNIKLLKERLNNGDVDDEKEDVQKHINEKESFLREEFNNYCESSQKNLTEEDIKRDTPSKILEEKGIDISNYSSKEAIKTLDKLHEYLKALVDAEVFNDNIPPVKNGLNIINIKGLENDIKRFFVDIWIGKVFRACKLRGEYKDRKDKSRGAKVDTYVVVDETQTVVGNEKERKDPFSYLNVVAKEARSVGFGLLVGAQSPEHFPPEFLRNFHLQVVLETNNSKKELDIAAKSFGIDKKMIEFTLQHFGNALIKKGAVFEKIRLDACERIAHLR